MTSHRVAAGTGNEGFYSDELDGPGGIFVDVNFDLYVADCGNDRIQLFQLGESNGITVAGSESIKSTIELYYPTGITLDAEKYLYIVDNNNHRIVGSSLNGFQCLVGCYGMGSPSNQLNSPLSFSFDRSGNMFITDTSNSRIQKFEYLEESCDNSSLLIKSMYSSSLTPNSSIYFQECSELSSYYEAIQMNVTVTGYYAFLINSEMKTMDAYIYTNNFNPFDVSKYVLSHSGDSDNQGQLKITAALQTNMIYVVVITTSCRNLTGNVSIQVSGPNYIDFNRILNTSSVVQTIYVSKLTTNSSTYFPQCAGLSSYYEAIQVNVRRSGLYTLFSKSDMDTYGSIYNEYFNPSNPFENRLLDNDDSCDQDQFRFTVALESSIKYILVVSAFFSKVTGEFSIFVSGPGNVDLKNISSPSAMRKPYLSAVQSNYSSELTTNSQIYSRDCRKSNYYYETIRVNVVENAYYALSSDSAMDTYGYIYKDDFNPLNPFEKLLSQNYRSCSYEDFNLIVYLHSDTKYILVVTTSSPNKTGKFSILTSGPNNITLDHYSKYFVLFVNH
ncbi:unnamed protein product [Adineta steineri]|uniref:NHL repeat containing protein n=1 Tax=Adineta steineri TaxID=433720 RepID=A0A819QL46_9BILA|nr:unnamed protein product [Adineta steineri]